MAVVSSARHNAVRERIRRTTIALFAVRGYHGTTLRRLANALRIEAGSLYYYFRSKQALLFEILDQTMVDLLEGVHAAMNEHADPAERLRAAVRFHVLFHAHRQEEAFISRSELRALTPANVRRILVKRDEYEGIFRNLLADGVGAGVFHVSDIQVTSMAILATCSGVAEWFSERGRLSAESVADLYAELVLQTVIPPKRRGA